MGVFEADWVINPSSGLFLVEYICSYLQIGLAVRATREGLDFRPASLRCPVRESCLLSLLRIMYFRKAHF